MAAHFRDDIIHGHDHLDPHASANKWRHQESGSFSHHARPRGDGQNGAAGAPITCGAVKCGPLLNYRRMENKTWFGSVLVVTEGGGSEDTPGVPELQLRYRQASRANEESREQDAESDATKWNTYGVVNGIDYSNGAQTNEQTSRNGAANVTGEQSVTLGETSVVGTKVYSDPSNTFWRFGLEVPMQEFEVHCEYEIPGLNFTQGLKTDKQGFFVPAISQSMRIMFHSCNGFSVGTDEEAWSGPALWNDVIRVHRKSPFHVMLGGGDQIYNDGVRVNGPLRKWSDIGNPDKRRQYPFPEILRKECDKYYVDNYIKWYSTEPFASANGQVPQLNLWDDHDIIDGFGSYIDDFMRCDVFRGIGGVANKYYLLFQHHLAPPLSTYTTDAPETMSDAGEGPDPRQLENTFVLEEKTIDSSYIFGSKPGPYVAEHSRSIYARLGARIGFFGIDARTERTRRQVNYPETYDIIFTRLRKELSEAQASQSPMQHLIVLLGIPIAYPRLTWLENIFTSPVIAPIKFLNKRFGFGGGFFNHFDGSVDLLDDLDDHYTAKAHKHERLRLMEKLQELAAEFSVRITILGGDVHLAAVGRFYSNPKLNVPVAKDHRYMVNVISSAIVNKPPPDAVANLLAKRNKIHHLNQNTDETLMKLFNKDPGNSKKTTSSNKVTMPSRNWAMITENAGLATNVSLANGTIPNGTEAAMDKLKSTPAQTALAHKNGHHWLHEGEMNAGTGHKAADEAQHGNGSDGSLDVVIRVEMDQHNRDGKTERYGMTIPRLEHEDAIEHGLRKRDAIRGAIAQRI